MRVAMFSRSSTARSRFWMSAAAAAIAAATSGTAVAQQAGTGNGTSVGVQDTQDIVVTAGKQERTFISVPEGISVVTNQQLTDRGATSLADYIALTPGLNLQSSGAPGLGYIEIRGISPQSVGATVATYIDDVPISSSSALTQGGSYSPDLDPSDLERVEVLKGPQGTLYGATSLGGVIRYVTKGPSLTRSELSTTETLTVLNNGQVGTELRGSGTTPLIKDVLGIRISAFYRHDAGYVDRLGSPGVAKDDANSGDAYGVRGALRWKPTDTLTVDLVGSTEHSRYNGLTTVDLDPATLQPLYGGKNSQYRGLPERFAVRTTLGAATVGWQTGIGGFTSITSYSVQRPTDRTDITAFYSPTLANQPQDPNAFISYANPAGATGVHRTKRTTEELRYNSKRFGPFEAIVGGFYQHEKLLNSIVYQNYAYDTGAVDATAPLLGYSTRSGSLSEYAGFLNLTAYLTDTLDVTGGYRHSYIKQTRTVTRGGPLFSSSAQVRDQSFSENSNTYLAGIRWRPNANLTLYGRAASGYRPGGGRTIPPGAPADFSPVYRSDSIWSYEAGVKYRGLGGRFTIDLDGFWIDWKDIQTIVYVGRFGTDGNGGKARSRGAEMQATYSPVSGLTFRANAAYTDARFTQDAPEVAVTDGQRIFFVPKWTATVGVDYRWRLSERWNAYVGGDYAYRSRQLDFTNYPLSKSNIFNIRGGVETATYRINLYVTNLTNKRIFVGDTSGYFPGFPPFQPVINQPRLFGIAFGQKF